MRLSNFAKLSIRLMEGQSLNQKEGGFAYRPWGKPPHNKILAGGKWASQSKYAVGTPERNQELSEIARMRMKGDLRAWPIT